MRISPFRQTRRPGRGAGPRGSVPFAGLRLHGILRGLVDPRQIQDAQSTDIGVRRIHVLRVLGVASDSAPKEPAFYNEFPADAFIDLASLPFRSQSRAGTLRMLDSFRVT
jgi:hypothetical protein